jgi:hypothetical protein
MAAKPPKSNFSTALLELKQEFDNFTGTGTFKTSNDAFLAPSLEKFSARFP